MEGTALKVSATNRSSAGNGFEDGHDLFHLIRVVEHTPCGPQAFLPPDAEIIAVVAVQFAAQFVQFALFVGALVGGLYGAEACLYLAVAGFAVQALVIWMSRAVDLSRQPEMACD